MALIKFINVDSETALLLLLGGFEGFCGTTTKSAQSEEAIIVNKLLYFIETAYIDCLPIFLSPAFEDNSLLINSDW